MAFCTNCGAELTGDSCAQCGVPTVGASQTPRRSSNPVSKWLLISFGILVAVLALVLTIVAVTRYEGNCCAGALGAERETVQTAIYAMMADNIMSELTANGTAAKITKTTDFGGGQFIVEYLRDFPTEYCYTWTTLGTVTQADCP